MRFLNVVAVALLMLVTVSFAQDSQQAPPLTNQNSYPSENDKRLSGAHNSQPSGMVDLNTATKKQLAALPGIGPDFAQTIIDGRPYNSKEDLLKKKVIPQATYNKIEDHVTAQGAKKQSVTPAQR